MIEVGQLWRSKRDGREVEVTYLGTNGGSVIVNFQQGATEAILADDLRNNYEWFGMMKHNEIPLVDVLAEALKGLLTEFEAFDDILPPNVSQKVTAARTALKLAELRK